MSNIVQLDRRRFLQMGLITSGSGLLVGCSNTLDTLAPLPVEGIEDTDINAWLHIGTEGTITLQIPSSEMGQGANTSLTMIVAAKRKMQC